jgi:hypothetical protein
VVEGFFDRLTLSYEYGKMMSNLISRLSPLIENSVHKYSELSESAINIISENYYRGHSDEISLQNITYLKNALEFLRYARDSPQDIQPILFHYSWEFFTAFFKYTLFRWDSPTNSRGILATGQGTLDCVEIEFPGKSGSFRRLVDCLAVLGIPTIFGKWLPIPEKKSLRFVVNDLKHSFPDIGPYRLVDFLSFQVREFTSEIGRRYGGMGQRRFDDNLRSINEWLLSYVLVFAASHLARYRPTLWRGVIDGSDELSATMRNEVIDAYGRYVFGPPTQGFYYRSGRTFLSDTKEIMEMAQDERWLQDHFNGSFVMRF